ncbi:FecR family protein [Balneola sp. MJW-20]|uniref:FecR family protein n=1 Tax=Gracilimonas aurantiaca TaxID=3234185 RepID=UPI00346641DC
MAKQFNIDPNDRDLLLAQAIGRALPDMSTVNDLNDPLLNTLLQYKESGAQTIKQEPDSESLWSRIDKKTDTISGTRPANVINLGNTLYRYAAAAVILILAFGGMFYYQQNYVPQLVGESFAAIEIVTLEDGSKITLRPYSKLYQMSKNSGDQYKLSGEALFEVTSDPERIFSVQTAESKVEVLGTTFIVSDWGDNTEVYLKEGSIRFSSMVSNEKLILSPGESATADEQGTISSGPSDESGFTDWLNAQMTFENASLRYIFSELEQHFNIRIQSVQATDTLSGTIVLDNVDQVLSDLGLLLDGTFTKTGDKTYRFSLN